MLDEIDLQLLDLMQRDAARTADSLSEDVPLSPSAISRRLRRLRKHGWIAQTIALPAAKLTTDRLQALVIAQWSKGSSRGERDRKLRALRAVDEVQQLYEITGQLDLMMMLNCANMNELTGFVERHLDEPLIERRETHFIMRTEKVAPFVRLQPRRD
ncbi:Lrp/AsnC family transcriptional regulator [Sphingomicrobium sediminis]|uniref:Lrp/AsnC family transcriptional regulator n=1 Tax=Sphingomicrobium sediminis TaxID=2950949 RepID=A0A9X2EHZ1_9SPHN|nr:Lrp/AsnC family transcriptional regulator [Sphingomicrobium sediminis]MCM8558393.1 Lrp/AsnC family transcriptional regulator [Sphingomicrobium sediminis]